MTEWQRAWSHVKKATRSKGRKFLKRQNHRANRRNGKALGEHWLPLDGRSAF